jgi:hypothetical protein
MISGLITMGVSGFVLMTFLVLFGLEDKNQKRVVLKGFRDWLDIKLTMFVNLLARSWKFVGTSMIRVSFHYLVHTVLGFFISLLHHGQAKLADWQQKNRSIVKAVKKAGTTTHLDKLSVFKKENTLTESQKKKLKKH